MSYFQDVNLSMEIQEGTLGSLNAVLELDCHTHAQGTMVFDVSGTWQGKIVVEGAVDGTYNNLSIVQPGGAIAFTGINNDNQNGVYRALIIAGYTSLRLRMSSYTSGTATVHMNAAPLVPTAFVWQLNQANLLSTVYQATGTNLHTVVDSATIAALTNATQKTQVVGSDGSVLNVVTRSQTPTDKAIQVQIGPGDVISNLPVVIEYDHHQIHEGEAWKWHFFGAVNTTTKDIRISVPTLAATIRTPHMVTEVVADNTTTSIMTYEGTTWTSGGTDDSARIYNRNRNISGSPSTKIYVTGVTALTVNAVGTQIDQGYLFTGKASVNVERALVEWVLKSNTEYLLRVTTSSNGSALIKIHFYEDLGV